MIDGGRSQDCYIDGGEGFYEIFEQYEGLCEIHVRFFEGSNLQILGNDSRLSGNVCGSLEILSSPAELIELCKND